MLQIVDGDRVVDDVAVVVIRVALDLVLSAIVGGVILAVAIRTGNDAFDVAVVRQSSRPDGVVSCWRAGFCFQVARP